MAIKRRERPAIDDAAIDSFGDAADVSPAVALEAAADAERLAAANGEHEQEVARTSKRAGASLAGATEWPPELSKTFLLRFPNPSIPLHVEELQEILGRNKHQTILLALRRGLDALSAEAAELGGRADLLK